MDRRPALFALGAALAGSVVAGLAAAEQGARAASAPGEGGGDIVFARADDALWALRPGAAWHRLPGPAPMHWSPVRGGAWLVTAQQRLQRWSFADGWSLLAEGALAQGEALAAHALAASADAAHVLLAGGERLWLFDAEATLLRRYEGTDLARRQRDRAGALFAQAGRRSFLAAWPGLGELWEILLERNAPPLFDGLVHDYRLGEGLATPGYLGVRRSPLGTPLPEFGFAHERVPWIAGQLGDEVRVVHLDVRRQIAALPLPGARPRAALLRRAAAGLQWWLPQADTVRVIDPLRWQEVEPRLALGGTVQVLRALGDQVCAGVGAPGAMRLLRRWPGRQGDDAWQPLSAAAGPLAFIDSAPSARQLLAAGARGVHLVDAEGHLQRLPAPPLATGAALQELRFGPGAA